VRTKEETSTNTTITTHRHAVAQIVCRATEASGSLPISVFVFKSSTFLLSHPALPPSPSESFWSHTRSILTGQANNLTTIDMPQTQLPLALHLLCLLHLATAQNMAAITADPYAAMTTPPSLTKRQNPIMVLSGSAMPSTNANDTAPGGSGNNDNRTSSLTNYYFGFLALIICAVGLCIFIVLRRRQRMMAARFHGGQQTELQGGIGERRHDGGWANWNPERRHQWHGRWRSAEVSREEGLNEYGEAPPVYVPKTSSEPHRDGQGNGLAVPLQTLSRGDAGLKPPDYSEVHTTESAGQGCNSTASGSSPRVPEPRVNP